MQRQYEGLVALQASSQPTSGPAVAAAEVRAAESLEMLKWVADRASGPQIKVGAARAALLLFAVFCLLLLLAQLLL
jgi:hypothetical protein